MDTLMLEQQIEFMQFEIDDLKARGLQQKNMYETMLKSLEQPQDTNTHDEIRIIKENHQAEIKSLEIKFQTCSLGKEAKIQELETIIAENEEFLNITVLKYKKEAEELRAEVKRKEREYDEIQGKMQECMKNSDEISLLSAKIGHLTVELDNERHSAEERVFIIKKECNKNLEDLRSIYDKEKHSLLETIEKQVLRIAKLSKGNIIKEVEDIVGSLELPPIVSALKSCTLLKDHISSVNLTPEETRSALFAIINLYETLEFNQERTKQESQCQTLRISGNTSSDSFDFQNTSHSDVHLKKPSKKSDEGISKPPTHTSKSNLGRTRTLFPSENSPFLQPCKENQITEPESKNKQHEKMIAFASSMECEFCKYVFPTSKFYEHILSCFSQTEPLNISNCDIRPSFQKVERMENQINELKLTLGKLKNQRDSARINSDKLLLSLKKCKLELAVSEENSGQKQMELKNEIKNLIVFIAGLRRVGSIPQAYLTEIEQIINRSSRIFGGKILIRN